MSDINPTRRTDEPPARDGAPLAGWPTTITTEEAVALRGALGQLQTALDAVVRERDEARAEVLRLRTGLHRISLASHNSMSSREECGRIAREALRDALDGLRYWDPQTSAGAVERSRITEKGTEALGAKS